MLSFWQSSVGKKAAMGLTGLIVVGFVLVHMAGNLQFFVGPSKFNEYSHLLRHTLIELTWIVRLVLLAAIAVHITAAWQLTQRAKAARPVGYERRDAQVSTYASRAMRWGGVYLLVFIVYHILHFTTGTLHPAYDEAQAYGNVVIGFSSLWVSLFYLGAMALLSLHLYHGTWACLRSLGLAKPSSNPLERRIALIVAIVVPAGFSLLPLSVLLGIVR
ncbi:MAG: succinate dehydrogenase cytochrome b subunit [Gemmatimonadaceae bacterium]|nr:succinate dehydrogenase cytochrome b subunit [Gemmatimonadaceae bacterium]